MTNKQIKLEVIQRLKNRGIFLKHTGEEYITRCPFCGDSDNIHKGHFYIRINPNDNYKMVYHCFKCEESGIITKDVLELLEIGDLQLGSGIETLNKTSDKVDSKNIYENEKKLVRDFDYKIPEITKNEKVFYIENRLKRNFSIPELEDMKVITSLYDFLHINEIDKSMYKKSFMDLLEKYFVGFLSYRDSYILFRNITGYDFGDIPNWIKYPITSESKDSVCFYSIRGNFNVFSKEDITINLSEGIMDIISVAFLLNKRNENTMNIAVTGKGYTQVLLQLLNLGIVGDNIRVNIYADNDEQFNKKAKTITTPEYFNKILSRYKHLYKDTTIHYNLLSKDFGVPLTQIKEKKIKI